MQIGQRMQGAPGRCHDQCRADSMARDVADRKADPPLLRAVQLDEIVIIAAGLIAVKAFSRQLETGATGRGSRQQLLLDFLGQESAIVSIAPVP